MATAKFNKVFKNANETRARYRVMLGSAGSGKSYNIAQDYIIKLTDPKYAGCSLMCIRSAEVSHLNSCYAELVGAINRLGLESIYNCKLNPLTITNTVNGNTVIFRGCNDQKSLERLKSVTVPSGQIMWVWCEESTEITDNDFNIIDDRVRGEPISPDHYPQITLSFNPIHAGHWIKRQLWDYNSPDIFKHKSTYLDNAYIDQSYKQRMLRRKELDPDGFRVYGLGDWGETGGLVFPKIKVGDYSKIEFDKYTAGSDFGFNHLHCSVLIGWKDGQPYAVQEVAVREKTTPEIIQICNDAKFPKNVMMWCDSAEPDRIKEFKQAGYKAYGVSKEKNVTRNQINFLKSRTIHVDGRCNTLHKELQAYKWRKDPITGQFTDEPVDFENDCIKAFMYGCEDVRKARGLRTIGKEVFGV